jgi:hypothetical protein
MKGRNIRKKVSLTKRNLEQWRKIYTKKSEHNRMFCCLNAIRFWQYFHQNVRSKTYWVFIYLLIAISEFCVISLKYKKLSMSDLSNSQQYLDDLEFSDQLFDELLNELNDSNYPNNDFVTFKSGISFLFHIS